MAIEGRPDQSKYLAHFTKPIDSNSRKTGLEVLTRILQEKRLRTSRMPWTNTEAICFTECPWSSMPDHAVRYSPYGIGFTKEYIFNHGGNPVFYIRPELFYSQEWENDILKFMTPFVPKYATPETKEKLKSKNRDLNYLDFSKEREWRLTDDLQFDYKDIAFLVVNSIDEVERITDITNNDIDHKLIIPMDSYKTIENLWPTHLINREF